MTTRTINFLTVGGWFLFVGAIIVISLGGVALVASFLGRMPL